MSLGPVLRQHQGYLTTGEVARRLGVRISTVDVWIRRGVAPKDRVHLPCTRTGNRRLIDPDDLSRFLCLTGRQPELPFDEFQHDEAA